MKFSSSDPDNKNVEVVRQLNILILGNKLKSKEEVIAKLRDRTISLQGTAMADTGLPFNLSVEFLDKYAKVVKAA